MNFAKFLLGLVLTSLLFSKEYLAVVDFSANNVSNSNVNALTQRIITSLIVAVVIKCSNRHNCSRRQI